MFNVAPYPSYNNWPSVTLTSTKSSITNAQTYTFTNVYLGDDSPWRMNVFFVGIGGSGAVTLNSIYVDSTLARLYTGVTSYTVPSAGISFLRILPGVTNATITINFSTIAGRVYLASFAVYNANIYSIWNEYTFRSDYNSTTSITISTMTVSSPVMNKSAVIYFASNSSQTQTLVAVSSLSVIENTTLESAQAFHIAYADGIDVTNDNGNISFTITMSGSSTCKSLIGIFR